MWMHTQTPLYRDFIIASSIVGVVILYVTVIAAQQTRLSHLGIIANFFTICFFASPLSTMVICSSISVTLFVFNTIVYLVKVLTILFPRSDIYALLPIHLHYKLSI